MASLSELVSRRRWKLTALRVQVTSGNFEWLAPCQPHEPGAMPMTWKQVPAKQLKEPALSAHDVFEVALNTKPSVGKEEVQKCHQWTQQYGVEGA